MAVELFIILVVGGLLLIGAEVFVPGGILGVIGGAALLGAIVAGFVAFGTVKGGYSAAAILVAGGISIVLWMKYFPSTALGKKLALNKDLASAIASEPGIEELLGKEGVASSELRPAGFATINGKRVDVVTQGDMISKGTRIVVVEVEANRVVVRKA